MIEREMVNQREKARAVVAEEIEFETTSVLEPAQVRAQARRAAQAGQRGRSGIFHTDSTEVAGTLHDTFAVRGPGGFVEIMVFKITSQPGPPTSVRMEVGDFLFQKGGFGFKPSINGKPMINAFLAELGASI